VCLEADRGFSYTVFQIRIIQQVQYSSVTLSAVGMVFEWLRHCFHYRSGCNTRVRLGYNITIPGPAHSPALGMGYPESQSSQLRALRGNCANTRTHTHAMHTCTHAHTRAHALTLVTSEIPLYQQHEGHGPSMIRSSFIHFLL
jgi:hypothetical protein